MKIRRFLFLDQHRCPHLFAIQSIRLRRCKVDRSAICMLGRISGHLRMRLRLATRRRDDLTIYVLGEIGPERHTNRSKPYPGSCYSRTCQRVLALDELSAG